jgi:transcriptional regulator with XRE-family HTH domain
MGSMGVVAVGAYFKTLADIQPGTIASRTGDAGVQSKYIWRLEKHEIKEPSAKVLRQLTKALNGNWEDVGELIADEEAVAADGRQRALAWALRAGLVKPEAASTFERATPEDLERAAAMLHARAVELQETQRHRRERE